VQLMGSGRATARRSVLARVEFGVGGIPGHGRTRGLSLSGPEGSSYSTRSCCARQSVLSRARNGPFRVLGPHARNLTKFWWVPSSGSESPLMWPHVARLGGRADTCRARLFARAAFAHRDLRNCFEFPPVLFPDCRPGGGFRRGSLGAARSRRAAEGAASKECVRMRRKLELPVVLSARCERRCVVCFNAFVDFAQSVLCSVYLACVSFGK